VLSGRGLCDELITRPEESYRPWSVVVCDLENLKNEEVMTRVGPQRHSKKKYSLVPSVFFFSILFIFVFPVYLSLLCDLPLGCESPLNSTKNLTESLNIIVCDNSYIYCQ
jgi:hypothetical protein